MQTEKESTCWVPEFTYWQEHNEELTDSPTFYVVWRCVQSDELDKLQLELPSGELASMASTVQQY
jgi:hypothetical protein